jgi:drug/metabolite transporter (DMT)-like permease
MEIAEDTPAAVPDRVLALGAALVTVALWASAFVGIRSAGHAFSPGALALGRLAIGSVILGAFVLARGERLPPRSSLRAIVLCGVLWFGIYNVALNAAERRLDAGTAAMLVNVGPILIALLAGLLLGEGFPRTLLLGCAGAFAGVAVVGLAGSHRGVSAAGTLLCLLAAAAYAGGVVTQKQILHRVSALQTTWLCCCVGALTCAPFAPSLGREVAQAHLSSLGWIVYLGAFPTALAFTTWAFALARTNAGRLGSTTYLVPPLSILLGWVILGETPAALAIGGGALCLAGVVVARRKPPARVRHGCSELPRRRLEQQADGSDA